MAATTGGEHRIRVHGAGQGRGAAPPERVLNEFVHWVALIERVGNALGALAFTWATVILLGGYPTVLRPGDDFFFATTIVSLEAARMLSSNNRLDYRLFFNTRGAFRPLGLNGLIVVGFFTSVLVFSVNYFQLDGFGMPVLMAVLLGVGRFLCPGLVKLHTCNLLRRAISLWSPLAPVLFLGLSAINEFNYRKYGELDSSGYESYYWAKYKTEMLAAFLVLCMAVLLMTISRLQFPSVIKLVDRVLGSKQVLWHRIILTLCMLATGVMLVFLLEDAGARTLIAIFEVSSVAILSLGNLQIPAAIVRVALALTRLIPHYYYGDDEKIDENNLGDKTNLAPSLNIFYGMVLVQGILYGVACIIELFSFIPRRSLARRGGFRGQWGVESVHLYYSYAFTKSMEGSVFVRKKINLSSFAVDAINSEAPKMQLHGIRMMHSLLQSEVTRTRLILKLNASVIAMARLISMLDWTSPENKDVRLFAAKVTAELATSLRLVALPVPGTVQVLSGLLDYGIIGNQQRRGNPLLEAGIEQEKIRDPVLKLNADDSQEKILDAVPGTGNLEIEAEAAELPLISQKLGQPWKLKCCQWIFDFWSIEQEQPLSVQDLLPVLGMSIINDIASCDQDNCLEISRASGLISKIIAFTSYYYRSDTTDTDDQRRIILVKSSLKLLLRLTSINGEVGITLRHKISKYPFFLRNLSEILGDGTGGQELSKLVAGILRNLAIDPKARHQIGRIQTIIIRLRQAFLTPDIPSNPDADPLLRKVAGQALAMLAMDSASNCLVMLRGQGYVFIKDLTSMIYVDRYRYVAASLLRSICLHAQPELQDSCLKELSYITREVLERILVADGAELEILIGLSSQICRVIPGYFARELEDHGQVKEPFVRRLVGALKANMDHSDHCCPGIRRVVLEQSIHMMEYDSRHTSCFCSCGMADALTMVEETASDAENYGLILGEAGLMEAAQPLPSLVATAKHLLGLP